MRTTLLAAAGAICLTACAGMTGTNPSATLKPTQGNQAAGTVTFAPDAGRTRVVARVSGLPPGLHGFHVHEKGDCSAPDAMSAGGHFNPHGKAHGDAQGAARHAGDLGNLSADKDGNAALEITVEGLSLSPGAPDSVIGRSVVVHANPDDLKSQPAGNSGPRVACGVVTAVPASEAGGGRSRYSY
jgi:Cu-Zn family superoxide dismutase